MLPYFTDAPYSPTGSVHPASRQVDKAVAEARARVAQLVGVSHKEIIFTSGATESNNLALFGLARDASEGRRRIVTSKIEHKSVLAPCRELARRGFDIVEVPVHRDGVVDTGAVEAAIDDQTLLVSIQAANGEVGTIQDIPVLANIAHRHGAFFHSDAAQALGKIPIDAYGWDVDLLSVTAHKCYGPKGIGALFIRGGAYTLPLYPLILGGSQEHGLRAGSLDVPSIVGFGEACQLAANFLAEESQYLARIRDRFEAALARRCTGVTLNGAIETRLPGSSSLTIDGVDAEAIIINMPDVVVGTGAACATGVPEPASALIAMQRTDQDAFRSIRVMFGRFNNEHDADVAATTIAAAAEQVRALS